MPRDLVYSLTHLAKAVETLLLALKSGKTLRNKNIEFLRRLTARKQVKDIEKILSETQGEECIVTITEKKPGETNLECCAPSGDKALKTLFPETIGKNLSKQEEEYFIISTIALTIINKWYNK